MQIRVTGDIERELVKKANQQGTTPELLAIDALRKQFVSPPKAEPDAERAQNLAEFLGDYIGSISSSEYVPGGAQMSKDTGKKFAEGMLKKHEEGRL